MKSNPLIWKPYFVNDSVLTPDAIQNLVFVQFSTDIKDRSLQELAYVNFLDFMDNCQDEKVDCSLQDVLKFFTGDIVIPKIGYEKQPTISFHSGKLMTSSTCSFELRLPICYESYESFKEAMLLSIKGSDGFWKC
jgi:hypothetical protein